ncbi:MAG: FliM/FliN family flagellar motor switch protein [Candidatus Hinthialibacter antarcticus]|nr:FliM/FliN family flagellar motor switch protein [Candidatus Hinthialibacter antarcticus]
MTLEAYDLKLIDLLSLQPGALLQIHSVRGSAECTSTEHLVGRNGWQQNVSQAMMPDAGSKQVNNLSSLLDIPIEAQVLIRHEDGKVVEMLRLAPQNWQALLERAGRKADLMVDGRIIVRGEIVNSDGQSGILIHKVGAAAES